MTDYYLYSIDTLQPVKMGGTGSQSDNENALDYIAGSTLRGAFIGKYLQYHLGLQLHENSLERHRWLAGGIRFLNGYLNIDGRRGLPFPACFYSDKDELRRYSETGEIKDLVNSMEEEPGDARKRLSPKGFVLFDRQGGLVWAETEKSSKIHINLTGEKTQIYRYETIAVDQQFVSAVAVDQNDESLDAFFKSFDGKIMHLGGSKSSGYGKCRMHLLSVSSQNPEVIQKNTDVHESFFVYCLSDVILRDPLGRYTTQIADYLSHRLGDTVTCTGVSVQTASISGFNNRWGSRTPHVQGIQKGSVYRFHCSGTLDQSVISRIQNQGIGERTSDGYGRVLFLSDFSPVKIINFEKRKTRTDTGKSEHPLTPANPDHDSIRALARTIVLHRIEDAQRDLLLEWELGSKDRDISRSMLAQWMNKCNQIRQESPADGKRIIQQYIHHLKYRDPDPEQGSVQERLNDTAYRSLKHSELNGQPWLEFIRNYVDTSDDVSILLARLNIKLPSVHGIDKKTLLTPEDAYHLNMMMLFNYFREHRRQQVRAGEKV
ncbi:RAMP superfamily CRISPR-associated protein [Sporolactobacillus sp. Y61]|uniref:RAMP superfamily CRISPR-associated protein n=1 Tax=Sporolactobacillus sp. Y61 TaxID=3160863 RepID=A0AAU8IIM4_9BACL